MAKTIKYCPLQKTTNASGRQTQDLNTGGMGAISPVPFADDALMQKIEQRIVIPTVEGLHKEKIDYKGFVFIGLIKVGDDPFVIEYNVRMGDPETEVVLPRIKTDLVAVFEATFGQHLHALDFKLDPRAAATVMLVSGGYPEAYEKGAIISGIDAVSSSILFHAGTAINNGSVVTNGGRVIAVTSMDKDYKKAIKKSYQNIEKLSFNRMNYRTDIGFDLH